ncbi:O-antigen ligase domain-containing protein [Corallincola luteus]|uniref:O-antigen ligase domain-containing protein n=1 Tax=Corallincola luteus TaxID=1775177 RepID=A0ABY2AS68_9GAMM|nr:O-antigen ligase family protein [Corallincola luteus]TCI04992.1 O-antigen ligase domain-containing protein [Corallincola luteus]
MILSRYSYCTLLLLPFIALMPDRNGTSLTLLLIAAGFLAWAQQKAPSLPTGPLRVVSSIFLAYAILLGINILMVADAAPIQTLHQSLRAGTYLAPVAAVATVLALANIKLSWGAASLAFPAAAIISGLMALIQRLIFDLHRAEGFTNAILFSDICVILVAMTIATAPLWPVTSKQRRALTWGASILGLAAVIMSGSRGSWLAIPILGWILIHGYMAKRPRLYWRSLGLLALSVPVSFIFPMVRARVDLAIGEISRYIIEGHIHSSVGARLEIWRISLFEMFPTNPWLGVGIHQFKPALNALAEKGSIDPTFVWISHPHNEWLYVLVEQGLVGLFGLLAVYVGCYWAISRSLNSEPRHKPLQLANYCLFAGFLVFGLTDIMTGNLITAMFFFGMIAWLALMSQSLRLQPQEGKSRETKTQQNTRTFNEQLQTST